MIFTRHLIKKIATSLVVTCSLFSTALLAESAESKLPADLVWENNLDQPVFASSDAKKGGTLRLWTESFPPTFRIVGPNSNGAMRTYILENHMSLVTLHPNTKKFIPQIATEWAIDDNNKTVYFKLNPKARWSDGEMVDADDFVYAREFHLESNLNAPWYMDYYTNTLVNVTKYDEYTISVSINEPKAKQDLLYSVGGLKPVAQHFYKDGIPKDWVKKANWQIAPNTGPYVLSKFKKGKSLTFTRKKDWWAKDQKFEKNRFNVDRLKIKVIRDQSIAFQHFLKGQLDTFNLRDPIYWHEKTKNKVFKKGYVKRVFAYNNTPRVPWGIYLNSKHPLLTDLNVRLGLQHSMNVVKGIEKAMRGDFERLPQFTSGNGEFQASITAREFDLKKAQQYFTKAGWSERDDEGILIKDGQRMSIELTYNGDQRTDLMVILREEAKKAGVDLTLNKVDFTSRIRIVGERKHMAYWGGWGVGVLAPSYWQFFHSENAALNNTNNTTGIADPELDKLIDIYRIEFDHQKRVELAHQIQQIVHDSAVLIPGFQRTAARAGFWSWVHLPTPPIAQLQREVFELEAFSYGLFWLDKDQKKAILKAKRKGQEFEPELIVDETFRSTAGK
ncbi:MAG: ABC transporter substrate-binding protein [Alteromonadales bacterium]|nr:ABC transporter substrate-binding protein [Alteromonadales bacterium]